MPALVILAAGLGRRFGGDKQLAPVGPAGEPLPWYALQDAARAGFDEAVLVIRAGLETPLRAQLAGAPVPLRFAVQESRGSRAWGTGHAVLAAAPLVSGPFMLVNADDFYGREAYQVIARFLREPAGPGTPSFALAAFPLGATLSPHGPVNRAVCEVDDAGYLTGLRELSGLTRASAPVPLETPVSMNCWGFTPALFPLLASRFEQFRAESEGEFMLPEAVGQLAATGAVRVRVLAAPGPWFGLTHPGDLAPLAAHLRRLAEGSASGQG